MPESNRETRLDEVKAALEDLGTLSPDEWNDLSRTLRPLSPVVMPCSVAEWHHVSELRPNDYNPNSVPGRELALLKSSVMHDGYTMGIVTMRHDDDAVYDIVDGFHRYTVGHDTELQEKTGGLVPIVMIESERNDRMASTVRHNRARGAHAVTGMANIVYQMLENGWEDKQICEELGMTADELIRIKHTTGFSKLFEDADYGRAWIRSSARRVFNEKHETLMKAKEKRDIKRAKKLEKEAALAASASEQSAEAAQPE